VKSVKSVIHHYRLRARTLCHLSIDEIKCVCGREWRITDLTDQTDRGTKKSIDRVGNPSPNSVSVSNIAQLIDFGAAVKKRDPDLNGGVGPKS